MGWAVRAIVVVSTLVVGCASIAGIDDAPPSQGTSQDPVQDKTTDGTRLPSASSSGSTSSSSSTSSSGGASSSGGTSGSSGDASTPPPSDAGPDTAPPPCSKTPNGQSCGSKSECCSNACANTGLFVGSCGNLLDGCTGGKPCCLGLVCRTFLCQVP